MKIFRKFKKYLQQKKYARRVVDGEKLGEVFNRVKDIISKYLDIDVDKSVIIDPDQIVCGNIFSFKCIDLNYNAHVYYDRLDEKEPLRIFFNYLITRSFKNFDEFNEFADHGGLTEMCEIMVYYQKEYKILCENVKSRMLLTNLS